jgi:general secretion pathway protein A
MFLDYYHLREQPFGVTPDPRFLYLSQTHREAIASLYYGVEASRGFLALIAEPGMGKTTLLFQLMERLRKSAGFAYLFQTQCDSADFLRYLLADMGIDSHGHGLVEMHEQLNTALMRFKHADRRFVLFIDEAQNLDDSVLETVRLLSDFETPSAKLMQIILSGQPQLALKLARPALAQLRQRIAILTRLEPLSPAEIGEYIGYRLRVAGYDGSPLFTSEATAIIAARSQGIPRNVNNLCFNALSLGCALGRKKIDSETVLEAVRDLDVELLADADKRDSEIEIRQSAIETGPQSVAAAPSPSFESPVSSFENRQSADNPSTEGIIANSQSKIENPKSKIRTLAWAASLLLACLVLFASLWRSLGYPFLRHGSVAAMPMAKSTRLNRPPLPQVVSTPPPAAKSTRAERALGAAPRTGKPTVVVVMEPRKTLYQICLKYFGRFDQDLFRQIRALNPQIKDPRHIVAGQRIVLPASTLESPGTGSTVGASVEPMTSARN